MGRDDALIQAFADEMRARRKARDISQEELAHRANVNRTYIAKLELAQNQPTLTVLNSLASALNCELTDIIEATLRRIGMRRKPTQSEAMMPFDRRVAAHLEGLARQGGATITYSDLLQHFGFPAITNSYRWQHCPLPLAFATLDSEDIHFRRPLRTSTVVRKMNCKTVRAIPGKGYFKNLCTYRCEPVPRTTAEMRRVHGEEMARLVAYYLDRAHGKGKK